MPSLYVWHVFTGVSLTPDSYSKFVFPLCRKLPSIYVFSYFLFGFEGRIWDLIVSVPDHCLSFYFPLSLTAISSNLGSNRIELDATSIASLLAVLGIPRQKQRASRCILLM